MLSKDNKIKLTISILVSNRKDTVPKCLESLRPLLEKVDSELIITDTGCDEELVSYMKKYTDNIVSFKWCNDFAAARNVGLNMAKGQWFMYIDDDEWFENVDELVSFFNSEEEKEYASASYVVRNYINMEGTGYSEGVVCRIFRVDDESRFVGAIHEQVKMPEGREKQFVSYVHHYGYVFDTEEKRQAHFRRNVSLLKKEIESNPSNGRNYAHIYQEYKLIKDFESALEYALMALKEVELSGRENIISMGSTYVCILWAYTGKKDYEKVIFYGKDFLKNKQMTALVRASLMTYMAESYMETENYAKAMECADEYIKYHNIFKMDKERYYKELGPLLNDTFKDTRCGVTYSAGLKAAIELDNLKGSISYLLAYDWSKSIYMLYPECLKDFVVLASKENYSDNKELFKDVIRAFGMIFTNISSSNIVLNTISSIKSHDEQGYLNLCSIMAGVTGQAGYNSLVSIINAYRNNDLEKIAVLYEEVVMSKESIFPMEKEFYEIAIDKNISIGNLISRMNIDLWKEKVVSWLSKTRNKDIVIQKKYMDNLSDLDRTYRDIYEQMLVFELENRKK